MRRGDAVSSVVLFLALIIIGIILVTWYLQGVSPTRLEIGTVLDDAAELRQHVANACGVTTYRASYVLSTPGARVLSNGTHLCVLATSFGSCERMPCAVEQIEASAAALSITKNGTGDVAVSPRN